MGAVLVFVFLGALSIGVPIAFALGIAAVIVLALIEPDFLTLVPQRLFNGLDLFALVAIPFFILAGELMGTSGILDRILKFSRLVAGRMRGSLAQVNVIVSMVFGWINGSGVAGASAVGSMMIKPTAEEYDDAALACAITGCSAVAGPIIPPSVPMIVYALVAQNVSVAALFAAGIVPGMMIGFGLMGIIYVIARIRGFKADPLITTFSEKMVIIRQFGLAFMLPFIMVGGIVGGIFTPVEAGAVAVLYALIIGFFFTRTLTVDSVCKALLRTGITSAVVFLMMGVANIASWILTTQQVPQTIGMTMQQFTQDPLVFLLLVNVVLLLVGLLFDTVAAMVMFGPILIPMAAMYGIDPVHFGIIFVINLTIGLVTPPVGICLFITSGIGKVPIEKVFKASTPFLAWLFVVLLIVTYFPQTFMWVPNMLGYR
jgi:tripartite ATP-independent transporter DctM subunit